MLDSNKAEGAGYVEAAVWRRQQQQQVNQVVPSSSHCAEIGDVIRQYIFTYTDVTRSG